MNLRFCKILILTVWFAGFAFNGTAQPNWELNAHDYEFTMTITGKITTEGSFSIDENDRVAAFVNGECRGVTKLTYESFVNEYFAYLMVYSNSGSEELTFKIFDASQGEITSTKDTLDFVVNNILGSVDSPFIFSSGELSSEAKLLNFEIPEQIGETVIDGNNLYIKRSSAGKLTQIVTDFSISDGASVFVDGIKQESSVSANDFSSPVEYVIVSASLTDSTFYTVHVEQEKNEVPTAIKLTNYVISESAELNTIVAFLEVEDLNVNDIHFVSLAKGNGVNDAHNSLFELAGDRLILVQPSSLKGKQFLSVLIRAEDAAGASIEESILLQVSDENDPPTEILLSNLNINESTELNSIVATLHVEDPDFIDSHQFSLIDGNGINDAQNNLFSIHNGNLILVKPLSFETGQVLNVLIRVTDKGGASFQKETILYVTNENAAPSAINLSNTFVSESTELFSVVSTIEAEDLDLFDSHQFSLIDGNGVNDADNTFFKIVGDDLVLIQSLDFEEKQLLNVLIRGTDDSGGFIEEMLVLQVTDANDPPTAIKLSNTLVSESTEVNSIVATIDVEDLDFTDTHQFSLITGNGINDAQNSYFRIVGDNLVLSQTLDFEDKSFVNLLIRVIDKKGAVLEQSVILKVTNENDPPKFTSTPSKFTLQGDIFVYPIIVNDFDNDVVDISFENLPDWITYNSNSIFISGVPGNDEVGDYDFKIIANDGHFETTQNVSFSVINVNDPPEINYYINNQQFISNRDNEIQLPRDCFTDPDSNDKLTFNLSGENNSALPIWLNFNKETLIISGIPPKDVQTEYSLKLTATDGGNLKEFLVFKLEVSFATAIGDLERKSDFNLYPNPVKNKLYIDIPDSNEDANVSISNIAGQLIKTWQLSPGLSNKVDMNGFESGIYFVQIRQGKLEYVKKIIKE